MRYGGKRAMGEGFPYRVKYRVFNGPISRWQYEFCQSKADAENFAAAKADCTVKIQLNKY
jgi:hypothetical protein